MDRSRLSSTSGEYSWSAVKLKSLRSSAEPRVELPRKRSSERRTRGTSPSSSTTSACSRRARTMTLETRSLA